MDAMNLFPLLPRARPRTVRETTASADATLNQTDTATFRLHPADNVVVARVDLRPGQPVDGGRALARAAVPAGHKVAVEAIPEGGRVLKYANPIGVASKPIAPGEHVHVHNLVARLPAGARREAPVRPHRPAAAAARTFDGIVRGDGRIATRNYVGILATVNCSATVARMIADHFGPQRLAGFPGVDGVFALAHGSGCAMSKSGEGFRLLRRTLAGFAIHPNFGGVLVLGLGCEQNQVDALIADFGLQGRANVERLVIQQEGGTRRCIEAGIGAVTRLLERAAGVRREPVPASHLKLALQCGGSDGYSGISANPALGAAADLLVAHGGTVVLSETPEIVGAEHMLAERAVSPAVARRLLERVAWWHEHAAKNGVSLDENPSEGNLRGGITTIFEKSLGAVAKAGTQPLSEVIEYAEPITTSGLVFMDSPGYDPAAVTGQLASGCNVVCFTTGRGSVFGCRPAPSLKLSTTTALFRRMPDDIDLDCGGIVDGLESVQRAGERIFELILATASGRPSCSERLGFGADEFVPWQLGAVL